MSALLPLGIPEPDAHDPGGRLLALPRGVDATAIYGGHRDCYRYVLSWAWDTSRPTLLVGMMNPSCADHRSGDATFCLVHRWAAANGFGRLVGVNADAFRAKDQARLAEAADPCGPENPRSILLAAAEADTIVVAYGQPRVRTVRDHGPRMARALLRAGYSLHVWGLAAGGVPRHPLYFLSPSTPLQPWAGPDVARSAA